MKTRRGRLGIWAFLVSVFAASLQACDGCGGGGDEGGGSSEAPADASVASIEEGSPPGPADSVVEIPDTPSQGNDGLVRVDYCIKDPNSDLNDIEAHCSSDGGESWYPAMLAPGCAKIGLSSSPEGTWHHVFIDCQRMGIAINKINPDVKVMITPFDDEGNPGKPGITKCFPVLNHDTRPEVVFLETEDRGEPLRGIKLIYFAILDAERNLCDRKEVYYSLDGGVTRCLATLGPGDTGSTNLRSIVSLSGLNKGTVQCLAWNYGKDIPEHTISSVTNVDISFTVWDGLESDVAKFAIRGWIDVPELNSGDSLRRDSQMLDQESYFLDGLDRISSAAHDLQSNLFDTKSRSPSEFSDRSSVQTLLALDETEDFVYRATLKDEGGGASSLCVEKCRKADGSVEESKELGRYVTGSPGLDPNEGPVWDLQLKIGQCAVIAWTEQTPVGPRLRLCALNRNDFSPVSSWEKRRMPTPDENGEGGPPPMDELGEMILANNNIVLLGTRTDKGSGHNPTACMQVWSMRDGMPRTEFAQDGSLDLLPEESVASLSGTSAGEFICVTMLVRKPGGMLQELVQKRFMDGRKVSESRGEPVMTMDGSVRNQVIAEGESLYVMTTVTPEAGVPATDIKKRSLEDLKQAFDFGDGGKKELPSSEAVSVKFSKGVLFVQGKKNGQDFEEAIVP